MFLNRQRNADRVKKDARDRSFLCNKRSVDRREGCRDDRLPCGAKALQNNNLPKSGGTP